jgi:uncharacterized membrane protein
VWQFEVLIFTLTLFSYQEKCSSLSAHRKDKSGSLSLSSALSTSIMDFIMYDGPIDMEVLRLCLRQQVSNVAMDVSFMYLDCTMIFQ